MILKILQNCKQLSKIIAHISGRSLINFLKDSYTDLSKHHNRII